MTAGGVLLWQPFRARSAHADPDNPSQVARGRSVYDAYSASCHGDKLQGQPNWQERKPDGKLPAPPHDASGHTWQHPDDQLFEIVKWGIRSFAPPGYKSDMTPFGGVLTDDEFGPCSPSSKAAGRPISASARSASTGRRSNEDRAEHCGNR